MEYGVLCPAEFGLHLCSFIMKLWSLEKALRNDKFVSENVYQELRKLKFFSLPESLQHVVLSVAATMSYIVAVSLGKVEQLTVICFYFVLSSPCRSFSQFPSLIMRQLSVPVKLSAPLHCELSKYSPVTYRGPTLTRVQYDLSFCAAIMSGKTLFTHILSWTNVGHLWYSIHALLVAAASQLSHKCSAMNLEDIFPLVQNIEN